MFRWLVSTVEDKDLQDILDKAKEREREYDWMSAVDLYQKALDSVAELDFSRSGEIQERIGYCLYRGAFQAETQEEFKSRMLEAVEAYEKAAEVYERVEHAKSLHCKAMALYANSWIHVDASREKEVLDECGRLMKETIKAFEEAGDRLGYGKACNDLSLCLYSRSWLEWDWTENKRHLEEAIKHSRNAISTLSEVGDEREVAQAYLIAGMHSMFAGLGQLGEEKRVEFIQTALSYAEKALELSKKTGDGYLISWSNSLAAYTQFNLTGNLELSLRHAEECLRQAKKTKDSLLIAWARGAQAMVNHWIMNAEEHPDKKREGYERVMRYAKDAVRHLLIVCRYDLLPIIYSPYSESYYFLACEVETNPKERRTLLERAIEIGRKGLEYAEQSGTPEIVSVHHSLSKALYTLSKMETQITEKKPLLEEASDHREKSITIGEQTGPFHYWDRGVFQSYAALIKAELATIETNKEKKRSLLEEAVSRMETCIELCNKWTTIYPQATNFAALGWYYDWFGGILNQLYSLTREEEPLEKAVKVYEATAETYRKAELPTRMAEAYWHAARLYDQLGEHMEAERNFQSASENYRLAAKKIPQLKEFYMDHALYMQAWSEIEKARESHSREEYEEAKEHYEKAASLHDSSESWKYLAQNYLAWAKLEEAEDLSRSEQGEEATEAFKEAANLFFKAKTSIKTEPKKIQDIGGKRMATELIKASDLRHEYCQGRIALEEAKLLDRRGDHISSSKKYTSAAKIFQEITETIEPESNRKELRPIIFLCQAWQKMVMAETKASPDLYREAAELFEQAHEHSISKRTSLLALGHSSFCKALEAGTGFEATRDMTLHSTAKQQMEAASNYYLKAGFKSAADYTKATQRLFDAYMYMNVAEKEMDPQKKAKYYEMAEKLLQASIGSYVKAKHPEKIDEVKRLLEKVTEEREMAVTLSEVLHAPPIVSQTVAFSTPTQTQEIAVGLERFEHADIQANLILHVTELKVGENLEIEIELVNAGKAPALLVKVEQIVPKGFDLIEKPEIYRIEDRYLNMKGRRLDPLKTEEVKLVLKPQKKGVFPLKPRVLYLDETGKYKSHEPEPVIITVKELGISGWLKGPGK